MGSTSSLSSLGGSSGSTSASCRRTSTLARSDGGGAGSSRSSRGRTNSRIEVRSSIRFSKGVPVSAQARRRRSLFTASAMPDSALLMRCASSTTTRSQRRFRAACRSARRVSKPTRWTWAGVRHCTSRSWGVPRTGDSRSSGARRLLPLSQSGRRTCAGASGALRRPTSRNGCMNPEAVAAVMDGPMSRELLGSSVPGRLAYVGVDGDPGWYPSASSGTARRWWYARRRRVAGRTGR